MSQEHATPHRAEPAPQLKWRGFDTTSLVFAEWCLRRETPHARPHLVRLMVLVPALMGWWCAATIWPNFGKTGMGVIAMTHLMVIAGFAILGGGIQFAARAVCWELSPEMRDLVRLTGLDAKTLLWSAILARWWTIGWSVLLMMPLAAFAITMGGVSNNQLLFGACGLALLMALVCSFGMLSSVLMANAKNPEKVAANTTALALVSYNLAFVLLSLMLFAGDTLISGSMSPWVDQLSNRIAHSAPAVSVAYALFSPTLFSPTDPGYWLHFLTAIGCAWLATVIARVRFRSIVSVGDVNAEVSEGSPSIQSSKPLKPIARLNHVTNRIEQDTSVIADSTKAATVKPPSSGRRPRCSDRAFFWKDVYVLSDERKAINAWTVFYCLATIGILILCGAQIDHADAVRCTAVAIGAIVVAVLAISLRFDALLTVEFRERTWGSLMLLPVDPCDMLWAKLQAAIWEQRFVVLPVAMAQLILVFRGSFQMVAMAGMTAVIAPLVGGVLCQISCINQLLGKAWWVGPVQAVGFTVGIISAFVIWVNFGIWIGFVLTSLFLTAILRMLQNTSVNPLARDWCEPS